MSARTKMLILAVGILSNPFLAEAQYCPALQGGPADLPPTLRQNVVTYRTGLQLDIDGAPNAYSVDGARGSSAEGGALDHICSGVNVLAVAGGVLTNKYPKLNKIESAKCLADYRRLRDAGFPACTTGECVDFYGIVNASLNKIRGRPCAVKSVAKEGDCGEPVRQTNVGGTTGAFYVSQTPYIRPAGSLEDQSTYPDARYVPYLVYDPAIFKRANILNLKLGDIALIAWKGRATFAVYGDAGSHLCEASLATFNRLLGKQDSDFVNWWDGSFDISGGALVVAFPGSGKKYMSAYPEHRLGVSAPGQVIYEAGMKALNAEGADSILKLVGLTSIDAIAKE